MKITLISPYTDVQSFGLRVISSCLKKGGHETQVLFLVNDFSKRYEDKVLDEVVELSKDSGLIGISLMTNFFDNAAQLTARLKKDSKAPIMWGGVHPTIRPEECLNYADIVCVGEGEETMVEIAGAIAEGRTFNGIKGISFKDGEKIVKTGMRPLIRDLESIPFPDYSYDGHYILSEERIHKMNENLLNKYTHGAYVTMSTRGCPFSCTYCCNSFFNKIHSGQSMIRKRNMDSILKELTEAKKALPFITNMRFEDDCFFVYTEDEIRKFSSSYKKDIALPLLVPGIAPSTFSRDKLSMLVDAGLRWIRMGIQTGSERTKRLYKRNYSNEKVEDVIKVINEFKDNIILPSYDIILDNPWETEDDLVETLLFLARLPAPYRLNLFSLVFYPETELYDKAKREGMIKDDLIDVYRKYVAGCRMTYLNRLFFLLNDYVSIGGRISPGMMSLLTNRRLRQMGLNWALYGLLKIRIKLSFKRFWRLKYYFHETWKDIERGDWSRIKRYANIRQKLGLRKDS